jgi:hypothetical protein
MLLGTQLVAKCLLSGGQNRPSRLLRADVRAQEGMVRPHGLAIRVVRALIGWAMSVRRRQKVGCRLLLNTNFQENIQKSWGREKLTWAWQEAKYLQLCCSGLKAKQHVWVAHALLHSQIFFFDCYIARANTSGCDEWQARLLGGGGGEGFIELRVCDAHSGRSVGTLCLAALWLYLWVGKDSTSGEKLLSACQMYFNEKGKNICLCLLASCRRHVLCWVKNYVCCLL